MYMISYTVNRTLLSNVLANIPTTPPRLQDQSMIVVIEELTVHIHLNLAPCGAAYCPVEASYSCRCFLSRVDRLAVVDEAAGGSCARNSSCRAGFCCGT